MSFYLLACVLDLLVEETFLVRSNLLCMVDNQHNHGVVIVGVRIMSSSSFASSIYISMFGFIKWGG